MSFTISQASANLPLRTTKIVDVPFCWHNQVSFLNYFSWEGRNSQLTLGETMILCKRMFSQERKDDGEQKEKVQTQSP